MNQFTWHDQPAKEVLNALHSRAAGLTQEEAKERLEEQGPNALPEKAVKSGWSILAAQFASPFMLILLFAAVVSFLLKEWVDVAVIALAVLVNSLLGFFEEYKADRSLQALKSYLPEETQVRRSGQVMRLSAADLVVGDVLLLRAGDKVTADARLFSTHAFQVSEAALTGESQSITKQTDPVSASSGIGDRTSMVFAGTQVTAGRAEAVVTATGSRTELGHISKLVESVEDEETPLQRQLGKFAKGLGLLLVTLAGLIFVIGLLRGFALVEVFYLSVALAVAAVPEGLVVAVTVVLAIGMQRILKKKALVRKLVAAETLGGVSVICMDKTGTLTTGEMEVKTIRSLTGTLALEDNSQDMRTVLTVLSHMDDVLIEHDKNGEEIIKGSPTTRALHGFQSTHAEHVPVTAKLISEIAFTSERKYAARSYTGKEGVVVYVLGAPDILLQRLAGNDQDRQLVVRILDDLTRGGYRVLLAAQQRLPEHDTLEEEMIQDLVFAGCIGLMDPLRKDSAETVQAARRAGLRPIMITGDHPETARLIAREAGIDATKQAGLTGMELDALSDEQLRDRIESTHVFARVVPEHKLRIIRAWQEKGKSVAMTGDGVNDAPALKAADIGIALGSGTSVAKETSDMVLLDNRFSTIVDAIREGRIMFENLRKMVVYLMTGTFSELILVAGALLIGLPLPILPAQILWINLVTDGLPGVALAFEPGEKGIMNEPPRKKTAPILDREMKFIILLAGFATDLVLFGLFFYLLGEERPIEEIRTFIFMSLGLSSLMYAFAVRTLRSSALSSNPFKNKMLVVAIVLGLVLQFIPIFIPKMRELFQLTLLNPVEWGVLILLAVANLGIIEIVKWAFNKKQTRGALTVQARPTDA